MCGTSIPPGVDLCRNCGGIISAEGFGTDRVIGNPDWGRISVDFKFYRGDAADLFAKIKACWLGLETRSAQRLFCGQLDKRVIPVSNLELYGPRESFARLGDELAASGVEPSILRFDSMPYDEIYKLREIQG